MAAVKSKQDYLAKYLSSSDKKKKKKVKKVDSSRVKQSQVRIVDDDVAFHALLPSNLENTLDEDMKTEEDQPVVVEVVDERPTFLQQDDQHGSGKWKRLDDDISIKASRVKIKRESDVRIKEEVDSDASPPRRRTRHDSSDDPSPPRRRKPRSPDGAVSPTRQRRRKSSNSDASPERRKKRRQSSGVDSDSSPVRRRRSSGDLSPVRIKREPEEDHITNSKGQKAGLSSAHDMKIESVKLRKKRQEEFEKIDPALLGKGAATVVRKRHDERKEKEEKEKKEREERQKEREEKYKVWSRGVANQERQNEQAAEAVHEASKPLARYKDDKEMDTMLKAVDRTDDPMAAYMSKKKRKKEVVEAGGKTWEKPSYQGSAPPNRFNIRPGYRWDGVDRSNGFEKELFSKMNMKKARSSDAYKWSTSDM